MHASAQPELSPPEWRAIAVALRDADSYRLSAQFLGLGRLCAWLSGARPANRLANPRLEAIRLFVCDVRRHRRIDLRLRELLESRGFNHRQIEALALLSQ
jgi:hypothetical protein